MSAEKKTVIYHNPRCSKSRQTLELLNEKQIDAEIIEYLKTPPDTTEIKHILKMLGLKPRELMRTWETEYKEAGLDNPDLTNDQLIQSMVDHPKVIQRPIVIKDGKAAIGRPPETVLDIL
ncbi:MAG: arsenate reductase (glutaredoxin) [Gammaproteobacteria bacterium]